MNSKLLPYESARRTLDEVRAAGKTIVQCHGTFDLIHPGHIIHFQEAKYYNMVFEVQIAEKLRLLYLY